MYILYQTNISLIFVEEQGNGRISFVFAKSNENEDIRIHTLSMVF